MPPAERPSAPSRRSIAGVTWTGFKHGPNDQLLCVVAMSSTHRVVSLLSVECKSSSGLGETTAVHGFEPAPPEAIEELQRKAGRAQVEDDTSGWA
jgi:hypothetical protein